LEKQRLSGSAPALSGASDAQEEDDEDEIDHSLAHISSQRQPALQSKKGRVRTIEWDESLEQMSREKAVAEANRGSSWLVPQKRNKVHNSFRPLRLLSDRFKGKV